MLQDHLRQIEGIRCAVAAGGWGGDKGHKLYTDHCDEIERAIDPSVDRLKTDAALARLGVPTHYS